MVLLSDRVVVRTCIFRRAVEHSSVKTTYLEPQLKLIMRWLWYDKLTMSTSVVTNDGFGRGCRGNGCMMARRGGRLGPIVTFQQLLNLAACPEREALAQASRLSKAVVAFHCSDSFVAERMSCSAMLSCTIYWRLYHCGFSRDSAKGLELDRLTM